MIPGSTNTWEQIIVADDGNVLPKEILSGHLVCRTMFKAGDAVISDEKYRIFYD